jgi:pyruvate dehydrogenase E2 component (dihydrolipoamide acetyltransferase)
MSIEFKLPSIGEGVASADIAEILVKPGDSIQADQVIMELETEKAVVELRCPHAGKLESLLVKTGDSVAVGQPLLKIEAVEGNGAAPSAKPTGGEPSKAPAKAASAPKKEEPKAAPKAAAPAKKSAAAKGGSVEFTLPNIGEGVGQADIAELLVKQGDVIAADQIVAELETEKAVVELRCPHAGKITAVHVKSGDTVKVGGKVLTIETGAEAEAPADDESPAAPAAEEKATSTGKPAEKAKPAKTEASPAKTGEIIVSPGSNGSGENRAPAPAAPSTRRLARELGVDLYEITGTGPGGRITHEDVQSYVRSRLKGLSTAPATKSAGLAPMVGSITAPPLPDFSRFGPVERQGLTKIGRVAAENLTVSWNVIPHVTQHDRADITDLEEARKRFANGLGKKGPKVTMTAIVMKGLSTCLQAFPKFNSSLDPLTTEIIFKKYYNIGCAVDTDYGLVVPVIKDCHQKSILQIAQDLNDLAEKARDRKLPIESMQGATCTVTNLGGIGGVGFTPIVNYPEVCILGMSRSQMELKLVDGKPVERMMLPLSLSYDHRVINGADAARFLVTLCNMLADPFQLLTAI